jgi:pimeloyl-ACP methyl ester carboxylesterase
MKSGPDGTQVARLADGRDLAFLERGDRTGPPVFYFHGTPSSRYEGEWPSDAAARNGFRLIAIDRPGYGLSDFQPNRSFRDWPKDVGELADLLGLGRFGVAGHSGGGAFTFAAACGLAERLDFAIAFCPWGPPTLGPLSSKLNRLDRIYFGISQRFPRLVTAAFAPLAWAGRCAPNAFLWALGRAVTAPDKQVLARPGVRATFARALRESFRSGGRGAAWEALICYRPWDFELSDIPIPVHVWAGDDDIFVPREMVDAIERELRRPIVHRLPGKGHLCIEHWDDAFAAVRGK